MKPKMDKKYTIERFEEIEAWQRTRALALIVYRPTSKDNERKVQPRLIRCEGTLNL